MTTRIPVLTAPLIDPGQARSRIELPAGLTLAEIIAEALPGLPEPDRARLRVTLVTSAGIAAIGPEWWHCTRPRPGVQVVIRMVPGRDALRSVLLAVVSVAALALAPGVAGLLGVTSNIGKSLIGAALSVTGALLVNALVPLAPPEADSQKRRYAINGWQNDVRPGEPVPDISGRIRYAPPFAAPIYTEIVGDDQYIRALFCFGYGPLEISDIRLGDTPITEFDGVEIELREGRPGDLPLSLYPQQVLEDAEGPELTRPWPVDDTGEQIAGPGIETPVVRQTAEDTQAVSVILTFPSGLFAIDNKGRQASRSVSVRLCMRLVGDAVWQDVITLDIAASERAAFHRQHSWQLPSRGKWEIEVTRMTDEVDSGDVSDRVILAALQSIRPEYPLNLDFPAALMAVRIRASHQLNGGLDNVNALVRRYERAWTGAEWTEALSRNPASAYLTALQGAGLAYPATDAEIDFDQLQDWYTFCDLKGLKYDRSHDQPQSLGERLREICAAGRATPRNDGLKWGVVIDRPETLVVDHISPRNASDISWQRTYFTPPHAFRVQFQDEANNYAQAERIVPWPGHAGDITVTEEIALPGKTDPAEIWIEARRRQYELIHRPDSFRAVQDGLARTAVRGDLVSAAFDTLSRQQLSARVTRVEGTMIALDEETCDLDGDLGVRFRVYADAADRVGTSLVRPVRAVLDRALLLEPGAVPDPGELVQIGPIESVGVTCRVRGIEGGRNGSQVLELVMAAPEIDTLTDAEVPPDWTGRVGAPIVTGGLVPPAPRFTRISSPALYSGGEDPGDPPVPQASTLTVMLRPADSPVYLSHMRLSHRLQGGGAWTDVDVTVASGAASITGYSTEDVVELQARSIAVDATEGVLTPVVTTTIGGGATLPGAIDNASVDIEGDLGHAHLAMVIPSGADLVRVYRVPFGSVLDRALHEIAFTLSGQPGQLVSAIDGDGTRQNMLNDPGFDVPASWGAGTGWSVSASQANHVNSAASGIGQAQSLTAGQDYRGGFRIGTRTAGSVRLALTGGTAVEGPLETTVGLHLATLTALSGNTTFALRATSDFSGSVTEAWLFAQTAACIPAGTFDYYLEAETAEGVPGVPAGPFNVTII